MKYGGELTPKMAKQGRDGFQETCCFTGPRPKNFPWGNEDERYVKPLKEWLEKTIRGVIESGYRRFISGMAIGVDMYAANIVLKLKSERLELGITLEAAVPFPQQADNWTDTQKKEWAEIPSKADSQTIIGEVHSIENFNKRNEYMVDGAEMVIAVDSGKPGGTQRTIDYAKKMNRRVVVVDPKRFL